MKNVIKYYYNLDVNSIKQVGDNYYLTIDGDNYLFCPCNPEIINTVEKYIFNNDNFHKIVLNNNNEMTLLFNNRNYVLLKVNTIAKKIDLKDIIDNFIYVGDNVLLKKRWIDLWSNNIDYIEYQISEVGNDYQLLSKYIYYYIGLAENAIQFLKNNDISNVNNYIAHKRIGINTNLIDFYNPSLVLIDSRVRDLAEYFKNEYFYGDIFDLSNVYKVIDILDDNEKKMFFARMLYPSYFFDLYSKIIGDNYKEELLNEMIIKSESYETVLKDIYFYIKKATYIDNIDWLTQ